MRRPRPSVLAAAILLALCATAGAAPPPAGPSPLPTAFRGISLGMTVAEVKAALESDALYLYRGDPDVSFLPQSSENLIECEGASYLSRAYFQFAGGRLYVLILVLDPRKLDHYSLFTAFSGKYGLPSYLDPRESVWQSSEVRFSLERPLTVKYIDRRVFEAQVARGAAQVDLELLSRQRFIEQF